MPRWRGHFSSKSVQDQRARNGMWRGTALHTGLITVLTMLFLAPPSLGWRGAMDCARRCHLAATTGAHCPLRSGAHHAMPSHHCQEQRSVPSHSEFRCACPLSSSSALPDVETVRFLLPKVVTLTGVPDSHWKHPDLVIFLGEMFSSPPDPPPRANISSPL